MTAIQLLTPIWARLLNTPFDASVLANRLLQDGGLDMEPLTESDLSSLIEGHFEGGWKHVTFSFSEMLAFYGGFELSNLQVIAWCFSALIIGEADRKGEADWGSHLYLLTNGFGRVKNILTYDEFVTVLRQALSPFDLNKAGTPDYGEVS